MKVYQLPGLLALATGCAGATSGGTLAREAEALAPAIEARTGTRPAAIDVHQGDSVVVRFAGGPVRTPEDSSGVRHALLAAHTVREQFGRSHRIERVTVRYEGPQVFTFSPAQLDSLVVRYF